MLPVITFKIKTHLDEQNISECFTGECDFVIRILRHLNDLTDYSKVVRFNIKVALGIFDTLFPLSHFLNLLNIPH